MSPIDTTTDADLVAACLDGDRTAFSRLVERYQRLLCSLAYTATGSIPASEDLAQEAFVIAWQRLGELRSPEKFRPWLCGILRHRIGRLRRREARAPTHQAADIDEHAHAITAADTSAPSHAMSNEEQTILWHALAQLPETYREPLVLYYREHRSVEHVAVALDLSEDAVKQRLHRGRKLLQERVLRFVEGALVRSTPGRVFTAGVLASIAALPPPARAAAAGGIAAKAAAATKSTGAAAWLAALSGAVSTLLALRAGLDQARTGRERRAVVRLVIIVFALFAGLVGVLFGGREAALRWPDLQVPLAWTVQAIVVGFSIGWPLLFWRLLRQSRELRSAERARRPERFRAPADQRRSRSGEYVSGWRLLGLPLVHIRFATPDAGDPPVIGWIAGGDRAIGILFAWGGFAAGGIAVGAVSVGLVSFGAVGLGLVGLGSIGVGAIALGAVAIGYRAWASMSALGWETAQGYGFALAKTAAEGPIAIARHANDAIAREMLANPHLDAHTMIFLVAVTILAIAPVAAYAAAVRRRLGKDR